MSSKLDQSLDEILAERPRVGAAGRRGARSGNAPAGGIRKRPQRAAAQKASATITQNATKTVPTGPSGKVAGSKIIVSNLVSSLLRADDFCLILNASLTNHNSPTMWMRL